MVSSVSVRDGSRALYSINYEALDAHTEESRAVLISKGFDAETLSSLDVRMLSIANQMAETTLSMFALLPKEQLRGDGVGGFALSTGRSEEEAKHLLQLTFGNKIKEITAILLPMYRENYSPDEIDATYINAHDPMQKKITAKIPIILEGSKAIHALILSTISEVSLLAPDVDSAPSALATPPLDDDA